MIPTLTTERLILRGFREEDLDAYAEICASIEVMRFIGNGQPLSRSQTWDQVARLLGHWLLRGYGMWAVEKRADRELIGRIGFINPEGWPGFELGWCLGRPFWGCGYATEGAKSALQHAFTELRRQHLISLIYPENEASIRVAQRLGETLEGETRLSGKRVLIYGINRQAAVPV